MPSVLQRSDSGLATDVIDAKNTITGALLIEHWLRRREVKMMSPL